MTHDCTGAAREPSAGTFLAESWGYLQHWHLRPTAGDDRSGALAMADAHAWRVCTEPVPGARCVGFRCGLEFKMPMRTAAVGWFLTLTE